MRDTMLVGCGVSFVSCLVGSLLLLFSPCAFAGEPYVVVYNEKPFHGEVTLAFEAALNKAGMKFYTSDLRKDPGATGFDKLHVDGSANYLSHEEFLESLPDRRKDLKAVIFVTPQYDLTPNEDAIYTNISKRILTVHIPHLYNLAQMREVYSRANTSLFLSGACMHKWGNRVERKNHQLRSVSMMPLFDVSTPYSPSSFLIPADMKAYNEKIKKKYIIVTGMISDYKRDYVKLLKAADKPLFFRECNLKLAGFINNDTISASLGDRLSKKPIPPTVIMETDDESREYPQFYASIQASRGLLLAHHHIHGDIPRHQYYEDQSSGNIGTAISNGVPLIGDLRLKNYYPELHGAVIIYKDPDVLSVAFPEDTVLKGNLARAPKLPSGATDVIATLQGYEFENLHTAVVWLGRLSDDEVHIMKRHVIGLRDQIITSNGKLLKQLIYG